MGAAGRDFHNFNMKYRNNSNYNVVAFTATQIPNIENRNYPSQLSGHLYPNGIPIYHENQLTSLLMNNKIDDVIFAYSDISNDYLMSKASLVLSKGSNFTLLGKNDTQLKSSRPVISIIASRTGCGKSQTSRYIINALKKENINVVGIRHPMPYGNLENQKVQRFELYSDLDANECTIEEREEYEPYVSCGTVVYAGIDYECILSEAENEADVILWDGGNNDMSFIKADIEITVVDPHRPGHELTYYPGQANVLSADIIIINKIDTASLENIMNVRKTVESMNPRAIVIEAASPISLDTDDYDIIRGKRVLVVEDGPTLTHGGMKYGAGTVAAHKFGARMIVDPREYIVGSLQDTFDKYPEIGHLLPAMGYSAVQINDLQQSIQNMIADDVIDVIVSGTPINLENIVKVDAPVVRANYDLQCIGKPVLENVLLQKLEAYTKAI